MSLKIKIKKTTETATLPRKISVGDWIDLYSAFPLELKKGETGYIHLGVAMQLPKECEAIVAPRSSTLKHYGVMQTNSIGIIDNSYCGNNDEWIFPVIAIRDTIIPANERVCQFRIQKKQPMIQFIEVDSLDNPDRGGFGSTGVN